MEYDNRIDDVILKILCSQSKCKYLELKSKVDRIFASERQNHGLKSSISSETFDFHLKRLTDQKDYKLMPTNRVKSQKGGMETFYFVTEEVDCHKYRELSYTDILVGKTLKEI